MKNSHLLALCTTFLLGVILCIGVVSAVNFSNTLYYNFDEGTGNVSHNSVNGLYNGTFNKLPTWVNGIIGNATRVNNNTFINTSFVPTNAAFSISFWYNVTSGIVGSVVGTTDATGINGFFLKQNADHTLHLNVYNAGWTVNDVASNSKVDYSKWVHVVLTYNTTDWKLYTNGTLDKTFTGIMGTPLHNLNIYSRGRGSDPVNASIDEFGYFNYTLNSSDVTDLYNGGSGLPYNPTVAGSVNLINPLNNSKTTNNNVNFICNSTLSSNNMSLYVNGVNRLTVNNKDNCYQETANKSTSGDGICGLIYTGKYNINPENANPLYFYDGDWNTYPSNALFGNAYLSVNYTVPYNATNKSLWEVKTKGGNDGIITANYSLGSCWNTNTLQFRTQAAAGGVQTQLECYNGTDWLTLYQDAAAGNGRIYEEAMIWNFTNIFIDTTINLPIGNYTYSCGINDGATNSSTYSFEVTSFTENNISYNANTYETSSETFTLNYNITSSMLSSYATFNYNGTTYPSTVVCSNYNCIATSTIDVPANTGVKQFYWTVTTYDGTNSYISSTTVSSQTINAFNLTKCDSGTVAIDFTSWDEQTLSQLNPYDFQATFNYYLGSGTTKKELDVSNTSVADLKLCISNNLTTYIDAIIAYSAPAYTTAGSQTTQGNATYSNTTTTVGLSYPTRNYFYQKYAITNVAKSVYLYLLKASSSTSFIFQVQDQSLLAVPNVLISIQRCYPGVNQNNTVFIVRTDNNGLTVGNIEAETALYQFLITNYSQTLLYVGPCQKIVPQTTPYTLLFQIGTGYINPLSYLQDASGVNYTLFYNETNKILTYYYTDTSGSFTLGNLIVNSLNFSGNTEPIVCNTSSNLSTAILTCNMSGYNAGTYSGTAYIYRGNMTLIDKTVFTINTFTSQVGTDGLFIGFLILLVCSTAFMFNEIAGIWLLNAAIIFINYIGLINFGAVGVVSILCISLIITAILTR